MLSNGNCTKRLPWSKQQKMTGAAKYNKTGSPLWNAKILKVKRQASLFGQLKVD